MAIFVSVKVIPNASKNKIVGWNDNLLSLRIRGVPEKGRVNEELKIFLADLLGVAKSQIEICSGHTSRLKRIKIEGISSEQLRVLLVRN
jgi:uncharacterized protein (TIGR00251 family)